MRRTSGVTTTVRMVAARGGDSRWRLEKRPLWPNVERRTKSARHELADCHSSDFWWCNAANGTPQRVEMLACEHVRCLNFFRLCLRFHSHRGAQTGSWEGASALWIAEHLLRHPSSLLVCLDTWDGGPELENTDYPMAAVEARTARGRTSVGVTACDDGKMCNN